MHKLPIGNRGKLLVIPISLEYIKTIWYYSVIPNGYFTKELMIFFTYLFDILPIKRTIKLIMVRKR